MSGGLTSYPLIRVGSGLADLPREAVILSWRSRGSLVAIVVSERPSPPSWVMRCDLRRLASLHSSVVHPLCLLLALRLADCARLFRVAARRSHRGRFTGLEPVSRPSR